VLPRRCGVAGGEQRQTEAAVGRPQRRVQRQGLAVAGDGLLTVRRNLLAQLLDVAVGDPAVGDQRALPGGLAGVLGHAARGLATVVGGERRAGQQGFAAGEHVQRHGREASLQPQSDAELQLLPAHRRVGFPPDLTPPADGGIVAVDRLAQVGDALQLLGVAAEDRAPLHGVLRQTGHQLFGVSVLGDLAARGVCQREPAMKSPQYAGVASWPP
jgi:hypothetical protein